MKSTRSSETSLYVCQLIRRNVPEDVSGYEMSYKAQGSKDILLPRTVLSNHFDFGITLSKYRNLWS
jgi:hypothetical protein